MAVEKKNERATIDKTEEEAKKTEVKLKHLTIKIEESLHRKVKARAALDGVNIKSLMQKLVLDYVNEQ
ncbi:hypothetical protein [Desulfobacula phenolica]|uniref:Uncharacterized protein n=1 Tax=Desulfobacula phenolica TaxID=90732 RepID=A0A1H2ID97_9BACT|nr:hypothetical protein [Desulfobacula phenolica]SDU42109.1 hypothetical protein SAMN04487931_108100 [Desulfobacula phenolica]